MDDAASPAALLRYLREIMILRFVYRRLAVFDSVGDGKLREHDLENYIFEALQAVPELAALQENFYPFYVLTAVRNLFFFLDPARTGSIPLRALVGSRAFAEWLRVLPPGHPDLGPAGGAPSAAHAGCEGAPEGGVGGGAAGGSAMGAPGAPAVAAPAAVGGPAGAVELLATLAWSRPPPSNWFSAANALRVYSVYLQLDLDQNGMLSPSELAAFPNRLYTPAFVARLFQECDTYAAAEGDAGSGGGMEIDYKTYLDVVLATEHSASEPSLRFLFKLLDADHKGWLGRADVLFFQRQVQERLAAVGDEPVDAGNVVNEVFDMVAPAMPGRITLADLRKCKMGALVCGMLLDAAAFAAYDRREDLRCQGKWGEDGSSSEGV